MTGRIRQVLLGVLGLALAGVTWYDAAVAYCREHVSASAPAIVAKNPQVVLARFDRVLIGVEPTTPAVVGMVAVAAREVARLDPLNAKAMRQMALVSELRDDPGFRDKFLLAERISRRDLATQMTLLQFAAVEQDYVGTFDHLDKALSTHPSAAAPLYPLLAQSLSDPEIRRGLLRYRQRAWFRPMIRGIADGQNDPVLLALLLEEGRVRLDGEQASSLQRLLARLVGGGQMQTARRLAMVSGGARAPMLDDFSLSAATTDADLNPLTWKLRFDDVVQPVPEADGSVELEVQPERVAVLAQRIMLLAPGDYVLDQQLSPIGSDTDLQFEWLLNCGVQASSPLVLRFTVRLGAQPVRARAPFTIPDGCNAQSWRFRAMGNDRQLPTRFNLGPLALRRAD